MKSNFLHFSVAAMILLVGPAIAQAGTTEKLDVGSEGVVQFDGLTFQVRHYDPGWSHVDQTALAKDGSPVTTDNTTTYKGTLAVKGKSLKLEETVEQVDSKTVKLKYTVTLDPDTPTQAVAVEVQVPVEQWIGKRFEANGEAVTPPETLQENWFFLNKFVTKLSIPSPSGTLVIESGDPIQVTAQDNRKFNSPNFQLRLLFPLKSLQAGGTATISFTITASAPNP